MAARRGLGRGAKMHGRGRLALAAVALGVVALVATAYSSNSGSSSGSGTASATTVASATTAASGGSGGNQVNLTAQGIKWDTTSLRFAAGVKVTNNDTVEHNFTFAEAKAAKDVEGGKNVTVSFTAPAAGTYKFFCKYHPSAMTGTVTVT
jgi:plastocyanin